MIISVQDVNVKIEKMAKGNGCLEFKLQPSGMIRMKQERTVECGDYCLYYGGNYYRRNTFQYEVSKAIPENGKMICALNGEKFLSEREDGCFEYSTGKKPLQEDFCMVLLLRALGRIIFLLADGSFDPGVFLVTLTDTPTNERFCHAVMRDIIGKRNPEVAQKLTQAKEAGANGKATEE